MLSPSPEQLSDAGASGGFAAGRAAGTAGGHASVRSHVPLASSRVQYCGTPCLPKYTTSQLLQFLVVVEALSSLLNSVELEGHSADSFQDETANC